jgi:hypothetical protein
MKILKLKARITGQSFKPTFDGNWERIQAIFLYPQIIRAVLIFRGLGTKLNFTTVF